MSLKNRIKPQLHRVDLAREPGLGEGVVWLRRLTGEHLRILSTMEREQSNRDVLKPTLFVLAATICDEEGKLEFDPFNDSELNEIAEIDIKTLQFLADQSLEFSGLSQHAETELKKNLKQIPPSNSFVSSPFNSESPLSSDLSEESLLGISASGAPSMNATPSVESGSKPPN